MTTLLLQRRLHGDCAKWRTVTRLHRRNAGRAMAMMAEVARLGEPMELRIVPDGAEQQPLAHWTIDAGWIEATAEASA